MRTAEARMAALLLTVAMTSMASPHTWEGLGEGWCKVMGPKVAKQETVTETATAHVAMLRPKTAGRPNQCRM